MEVGLRVDIVLHGDPAPASVQVTLCSMGTKLPPEKRAHPPHPIFGPCLLWPNGWMDEDATWYGSRPRPRPHCIRWGPSSPRKGHSSPPSFWPMSIVASVADLSYCWALVVLPSALYPFSPFLWVPLKLFKDNLTLRCLHSLQITSFSFAVDTNNCFLCAIVETLRRHQATHCMDFDAMCASWHHKN